MPTNTAKPRRTTSRPARLGRECPPGIVVQRRRVCSNGPSPAQGQVRHNRPNVLDNYLPMTRIAAMENVRPTLLVVEDNEDDIFFIERIFKQLDARCELKFARDGIEAVDYLSGKGRFKERSKFPLPTMILMDLKMPRMNGFEVLEWMQKQPELKLI